MINYIKKTSVIIMAFLCAFSSMAYSATITAFGISTKPFAELSSDVKICYLDVYDTEFLALNNELKSYSLSAIPPLNAFYQERLKKISGFRVLDQKDQYPGWARYRGSNAGGNRRIDHSRDDRAIQ